MDWWLSHFVSELQALHNPAYSRQSGETNPLECCEPSQSQPWQLQYIAEAADFGDSKQDAAERCRCVAELLAGMLQPDVAQRMTAKQLAAQQWLSDAGNSQLGPCPKVVQKILQK